MLSTIYIIVEYKIMGIQMFGKKQVSFKNEALTRVRIQQLLPFTSSPPIRPSNADKCTAAVSNETEPSPTLQMFFSRRWQSARLSSSYSQLTG